MALDLYQNFISAQYLENIWIEFQIILAMSRLGLLPVISQIFNQVMALDSFF